MNKLKQSQMTAALALTLTLGACGQSTPPQTIEETRAAAAESAKVEAEARMDALDKKKAEAAKRAEDKPQ